MINNYLSLIKFSHTIFALPFAVIGFFIATRYDGYAFSWFTLVLVLLCMVFARSAAMAFNRYTDRDIDKKNKRTAAREIPKGIISERSALIFVILNASLFVITTYFINPLCFILSPVALALILGYSYTKRFTYFSHFVLGLGLSLAPIGAYLAVTEHFELLPLFFSFSILFWVSGFDIIYALQDEYFDKENKLYSIPLFIGKKNALTVSVVLHAVSASFIILAGIYANFGLWYWLGCFIFIGLLSYQHIIVKPNDLSKVNLAFFTTNGIGSVIFALFVLVELFTK